MEEDYDYPMTVGDWMITTVVIAVTAVISAIVATIIPIVVSLTPIWPFISRAFFALGFAIFGNGLTFTDRFATPESEQC